MQGTEPSLVDDLEPPGRPVPPVEHQVWPEWLTPEYRAIHTAFENEIKRALGHCYQSADASGMDYTTEGWISCSASNLMGLLERLGCLPPPVGDVVAAPMPDHPGGPDEGECIWCWDGNEPSADEYGPVCADHRSALLASLSEPQGRDTKETTDD
jgi:hypothetical protein